MKDRINELKLMHETVHGLYQATPEVFAFAKQFQPQIINLE